MKNNIKFTSTLLAIVLLSACSLPSWSTYTNATYQFQLQYPSSGSLVTDTPSAARIQLPIQSGTNLVESYLDIAIQEGAMPCLSPYGNAYAPPPGTLVTDEGIIGGDYFVVERASEGAAGTLYDWIAYSTANATDCVSLTFVLVSTHPEAHPTPVPAFDMDTAEALFLSIVNTFTWLIPTYTPLPSLPPPALLPSSTPTFAPYQFIPKFNAHCRSGPDMAFSSITLAMQGQSYPIDGRNLANTWLYLTISPQVGCWVPIEDGTPSMDTSAVRVLADIPTPTFTTAPFSCGEFKDPQSCSQHTECHWNRLVVPGICQNK